MKASGKSKLYTPTEKGRKHIRQKLSEFKFVFQHILDGGAGVDPGKPEKSREATGPGPVRHTPTLPHLSKNETTGER
jgi:DNA-binding PadR family transcriptional regulator